MKKSLKAVPEELNRVLIFFNFSTTYPRFARPDARRGRTGSHEHGAGWTRFRWWTSFRLRRSPDARRPSSGHAWTSSSAILICLFWRFMNPSQKHSRSRKGEKFRDPACSILAERFPLPEWSLAIVSLFRCPFMFPLSYFFPFSLSKVIHTTLANWKDEFPALSFMCVFLPYRFIHRTMSHFHSNFPSFFPLT